MKQTFDIAASPAAFDILANKLYSNQRLAILRELTTNAADAQIAAGQTDKNIILHIPTESEQYFKVRDFGNGLSEDEIFRAARQLRTYTLHITGSRGFDEAQVTAGGADCVEFDPSTMESKIVKNLFASGEVLNVDGDCGGYNLMFAFISGILAGRNGSERKKDTQ